MQNWYKVEYKIIEAGNETKSMIETTTKREVAIRLAERWTGQDINPISPIPNHDAVVTYHTPISNKIIWNICIGSRKASHSLHDGNNFEVTGITPQGNEIMRDGFKTSSEAVDYAKRCNWSNICARRKY